MIETAESRARLTHDLMTVDRMIAHHEAELRRQWRLRGDLRARLGEVLPPVVSVPQEPVGPPEQPPGTSEQFEDACRFMSRQIESVLPWVPMSEVDRYFSWFDEPVEAPEPDPSLDDGRHHWRLET